MIALVLAGAAVVVAALAWQMRRHEDLFPLAVILALPFRLPISSGGRSVNLLIPLYLVVAAGALALLLPALIELRRGGRGGIRGDSARIAALARGGGLVGDAERVERLLAATVVLYVLQASYSSDHTKAAENIAFFYLPFGLMFLCLRQVRWTRELLLRCLALAVALAVVFAGVGFVEYYRKALFLNPKVVAADQFDNYFRVNSLFFDPSIYGRFLALVMVAVTAVLLWSHRRREIWMGAAVLAWLICGLVTSFSQSSIAALLLGLAVLAGWRWDVRRTAYVSIGVLALAGAVVLAAPTSLHFGLKGSKGSTSNATSGRTTLIGGGLELFADRPLSGYGSGSFEREYKRHASASEANAENATSASHTIPITVAAEQGVVGLAVYLALLAAALGTLFRGARGSPARMAIAACFAALVLHTWVYADFLEDPTTWVLLALGVALARESQPGSASSV